MTRSPLEAALDEARLIRELKPPYNRMLKSAAPAFFIKLDLMDEFPRVTLSTKMSARRGVMHLGPFIGRRGIEHSIRALSRILGLRTCGGKLAPSEEISPCIYGQMGHCTAPCNMSIDIDGYAERVRRAVEFSARTQRPDPRRIRALARPGGGRDALRGGRPLSASSRSLDHARASRDPAERSGHGK